MSTRGMSRKGGPSPNSSRKRRRATPKLVQGDSSEFEPSPAKKRAYISLLSDDNDLITAENMFRATTSGLMRDHRNWEVAPQGSELSRSTNISFKTDLSRVLKQPRKPRDRRSYLDVESRSRNHRQTNSSSLSKRQSSAQPIAGDKVARPNGNTSSHFDPSKMSRPHRMQASPDSERSIAESMSRLYISDKGYIRGISKLKEICPFLTRNTLYNLLLENNMDFEAAKAFALNLASQFLDRKRFRQPSRERESCLGRAPPQSKLKSDWDFNDSYFDWDSYATSDSEYDRYLDKRDQVLGRKSPGTPTQARRRKKERTHAQKSKSYSKSRRMARGERSESDSVRDFVTSDGSYASDWSGTYMPSNSSTSSSSSLRNGHSLESQPSCTDSEGCRMASNSGLTNDEDDLEIDMENPWGNL